MTDEKIASPRKLKGLMVPADPRVKVPNIETKSVQRWLIDSDIEFMEIVHGRNSRLNDFTMVVDDEGRQRGLSWNARAQFLSGYPMMAPILGNAIFFSEGFGADGMDLQNLTDSAVAYLTRESVADEYSAWQNEDDVRTYAREYEMRYPFIIKFD